VPTLHAWSLGTLPAQPLATCLLCPCLRSNSTLNHPNVVASYAFDLTPLTSNKSPGQSNQHGCVHLRNIVCAMWFASLRHWQLSQPQHCSLCRPSAWECSLIMEVSF
jgi:hypothetical protein